MTDVALFFFLEWLWLGGNRKVLVQTAAWFPNSELQWTGKGSAARSTKG